MKNYEILYTALVSRIATVRAENKEDARRMFDDGDADLREITVGEEDITIESINECEE
jgi:hypothetical protein